MSGLNQFLETFERIVEPFQINLNDDALHKAGHYLFLLQTENKKLNLTGYKTIEEMTVYHFIDALNLIEHLKSDDSKRIIDIGSGAGIPGLFIALALPHFEAFLVESIKKKADFISRCKEELELSNVTVCAERAETLAKDAMFRESFDIATARALAGLSACLELAAPFCRIGGKIVLPRGVEESVNEHCASVLGIQRQNAFPYSLPGRNDAFRVIVWNKCVSTQEKYPRMPGQIRKRPL